VKTLRTLLRDPDNRLWDDSELGNFLDYGLTWWNMAEPATNFHISEVGGHDVQGAAVLWAAVTLALTHLLWNPTSKPPEADKLSVDRQVDYEKLCETAEEYFQFAKEAKRSVLFRSQPTLWH
jgi:hypothetical protein